MARARTVLGSGPARLRTGGFTLLEILAAIAIVGISGTMVVVVLVRSLDLAESNRARQVAMEIAYAKLFELRTHPEQFEWPEWTEGAGDTLLLVVSEGADEGPLTAEGPAVVPYDTRSHGREGSFYRDFLWQAYARYPRADSAHLEVTVVVTWTNRGRTSAMTVTSAVPRAEVEGAA